MSKLGDKMAVQTGAVQALAPTTLGRFQSAGARGELVTLPVLGPAWIELAGHDTVNEIESAVFREMKRLELEPNYLNALTYEADRARRTLAECVRDPSDHAKRFGDLEEWGAVDSDVINACWQLYGDVRERLDPIGMPTLADKDSKLITAALQKKNGTALRSFGVAKLSLYLLTTADRPASSPTPPSSPGDSSSTTA